MWKSLSGMLINPRIVFRLMRQRWSSTTFSPLLALIVWTSNTYSHLAAPTFFPYFNRTLFKSQHKTYSCMPPNVYVLRLSHDKNYHKMQKFLVFAAKRREIIVRGQSYFSRLPKYWPPIPLSARRVCPPPATKAEVTHSPGGDGGRGVNILEDERNRIALLQWSLYAAKA